MAISTMTLHTMFPTQVYVSHLRQAGWLRAQAAYDTEVAERSLAPVLGKIKPWVTHAVQQRDPVAVNKAKRAQRR